MSKNESGQVSRRSFLGCAGAVSAAGVVAVGTVNPAAALAGGSSVRTFKGKYVVDGHRILDGFMASPRGKTGLDVVVVVSESGTLDSTAEATARRYAASGWLAIAPDLTATYRKASGDKQAMVAALTRDLPRLKKLSRGSGKVAIVAA